jgi:AraC-like DNA-binding protein
MATRYPWTPVDPLGEALHAVRMEGAYYVSSELREPWSLEMPPFEDCVSFHALISGTCWIEVPGAPPVELRPGDFMLVAHGLGHRMYSDLPAAFTERVDLVPHEQVGEHYHQLRYGGGGAPSTMICGIVSFGHPLAREVLDLLPPLVHITGVDRVANGRMQTTLDLLAAEAREPSPGGEAVITRLADILIVQTIRWWIASQPGDGHGIVAALRDPQIGRAILAVHREPGKRWTVAALADCAVMSRSAFSERFTRLVGTTAMHYVSRLRMQHALARLKSGDTRSLAQMALDLGYGSEAAFSRAFKSMVGVAPGSLRRSARERSGLQPSN